MKILKIAFDVDNTLIKPSNKEGERDVTNLDTVWLFEWFQKQGHFMIVWSGGGTDYAQMWCNRIGITPDSIVSKDKLVGVDIAFDDQEVDLAKINIQIKHE